MEIKKKSESRISSVDFNNLPFGAVFSDHMLICNYKNGNWDIPQIKPYGAIELMPGSQVFHYGQAIFEGMKAFKDPNDDILLFRKHENFKRFNQSAERMSMPKIPENIFMNGIDTLLNLDNNWLKNTDKHSLYIRPFLFASGECVKASSSNEYTFMIITCPSANYYNQSIDMIVEEFYSRAAKGGVGYAKASGNYAASFLPTIEANKKGFTQIIWTDAYEHKYIEESGTMNIWFLIKDQLITPSLSDTILAGITRDSMLTIAQDMSINVIERKISVEEICNAAKNNDLKEAFGTGTAVSVAPISSITYQNNKLVLPKVQDPISLQLKKKLQDIQRGRAIDPYSWIDKVKEVMI